MTKHGQHHTHQAHICTLAIANMALTLRCDDEQIIAAVCQRYQAFLGGGAAQLTLDVVLGSERYNGDAAVLMDGWTVQDAVLPARSRLDVEQGGGQVIVPRPQALELTEYWLRVAYALLAFRAGGLLFHAAGIVRHGRAFLFCGRSGSGKTTVARLSPNDIVLNDDLVVLMPDGAGGWIAHATPFFNPTQVQPTGPQYAPVAAVLRLVQDTTVDTRPMHAGLAVAELLANAPIVSATPALSSQLIERCRHIQQVVPVRHLHFLPDPSFWPVVEAVLLAP